MNTEMKDYPVGTKLDFYRILIGTGSVNTLKYYKEIPPFPLLSFIIPIRTLRTASKSIFVIYSYVLIGISFSFFHCEYSSYSFVALATGHGNLDSQCRSAINLEHIFMCKIRSEDSGIPTKGP